MVNLLVKVMFSTLIIDLSIGFAWIGLLGWMELKDTFNKAFPNADLSQFKALWRRLRKKVSNDTKPNN